MMKLYKLKDFQMYFLYSDNVLLYLYCFEVKSARSNDLGHSQMLAPVAIDLQEKNKLFEACILMPHKTS